MRIATAFLTLVLLASVATAQPSLRALSVVDGLGVDEQQADKLIPWLSVYDEEHAHLNQQRRELKRRLVTARHDDPKTVDKLIDDAMANQRALLHSEEKLVTRVRQVLSPSQTAQLLVLLAATETEIASRKDKPQPSYATRPANDPNTLWPPGSQNRTCDPFASMHGCRSR